VPEEFTEQPAEMAALDVPESAPADLDTASVEAASVEDAAAVPWPALCAVLCGGFLEEACRALPGRVSPASAAARINEYFTESLGDVVLEQQNGKWRLIEDYRDDVQQACADFGGGDALE